MRLSLSIIERTDDYERTSGGAMRLVAERLMQQIVVKPRRGQLAFLREDWQAVEAAFTTRD